MPHEKPKNIEEIAPALGLLAHDLRNPASAILANLNFLEGARGLLPADERDALADAIVSVRDLMVGIEHLGWLSRAIRNEPIVALADADVGQALRAFAARTPHARLEVSGGPLHARSASGLVRVLDLLAGNASQHAPHGTVTVRAARAEDCVVVTFIDEGMPISPVLRADAFALHGQVSLKGRADGRYGRMLGLAAIGVLARAMGATVEAGEERGCATFVLRLVAA